jgi:hypothetical protein
MSQILISLSFAFNALCHILKNFNQVFISDTID